MLVAPALFQGRATSILTRAVGVGSSRGAAAYVMVRESLGNDIQDAPDRTRLMRLTCGKAVEKPVQKALTFVK
jgi:hypothetical protein